MKFILSPNWRPQATRPRIANARAVSEKLLLRPQPRSARHRCKRTASRASAGSDATSAVVGVEALSTGSQKSAKSANGRSTGRYAVSISASRAEPQCCRSSAKVGNGRPIFRGRFGRVPKRRPPPLDESRRSSALAGGDDAAAAGDAPHLA